MRGHGLRHRVEGAIHVTGEIERARRMRRTLIGLSSLLTSLPMATSARGLRFRSWPITEAAALEPSLRSMGLKVPASEIDGTAPGGKGGCLSDALVSVGPAGRQNSVD